MQPMPLLLIIGCTLETIKNKVFINVSILKEFIIEHDSYMNFSDIIKMSNFTKKLTVILY